MHVKAIRNSFIFVFKEITNEEKHQEVSGMTWKMDPNFTLFDKKPTTKKKQNKSHNIT